MKPLTIRREPGTAPASAAKWPAGEAAVRAKFMANAAFMLDADITPVDLNLERTVRHEDLLSYSDYGIYDGWTFKGWAVEAILRDGRLVGAPGGGRYLFRRSDDRMAPAA
jgi:hypothetical protein